MILATNPSMEGEVTATYIQQLLAGHGRAGHPARARAARWAATSSTSTASRWRTRWSRGRTCPDAVARGWLFAGGRGRGRGRRVAAGAAPAHAPIGATCSVRARSAGSPRWASWPARAGVETVRLLRDYLAWERQPVLRRRAEAILRRMEATLA